MTRDRASWLWTQADYFVLPFFSSCVEAQPPLPLQEFFPLQPLSLELQPPLPLQEFWPLQSCLLLPSSCDAAVPACEFAPSVLAEREPA